MKGEQAGDCVRRELKRKTSSKECTENFPLKIKMTNLAQNKLHKASLLVIWLCNVFIVGLNQHIPPPNKQTHTGYGSP